MLIKKIDDYYEQMHLMYPYVDIQDIKRILKYGWRMFYLHNSYGGDVQITDLNFWCYCGYLKKDSIKWFEYYIKKLIIKIRVLYKRRHIKWDGYYYFGISKKLYNNYLALKHKRGRPRKWFNYGDVKLFKIKDECLIASNSSVAIFRVPFIDECGMHIWKENYKSDKAELIQIREPLKFKDVLVTNNNYLSE